MMTEAPAKKEYHFAATIEHYAEVVYAATIQEAEAIYHKVKRPVISIGVDDGTKSDSASVSQATSAPLSTLPPAPQKEDVQ